MIYALCDMEGVEAFKITQESLEKTTVQIVKSAIYREDGEHKIVEEFKKRLGQAVTVHLNTPITFPKSGPANFGM